MEFTTAKSRLSAKSATGASVFEHLSRVVQHILRHDVKDPLEEFENISLRVKQDADDLKSRLISAGRVSSDIAFENDEDRDAVLRRIQRLYHLYGKDVEWVPEPQCVAKDKDQKQEAVDVTEVVTDADVVADDSEAVDPKEDSHDDADGSEQLDDKSESVEEDDATEVGDDEENEEKRAARELRLKHAPLKAPNVLKDAYLLKWAGIGFDDEELFQLQCALTALVRANSELVNTCRFWGKVHGTDNDYWIAEISRREIPEFSEEQRVQLLKASPQRELPGEGVNEKVYFVSTDVANPKAWVRLPDIENPECIVLSRAVRKLLTGNLEAHVSGLSAADFKWTEALLLRAIIARITSSCMLAPTGYYKAVGAKDGDDDEEDEDGSDDEDDGEHATDQHSANGLVLDPTFDPMAEDFEVHSLNGWVHTAPHLLAEGRFTAYIAPKPVKEDGDAEDGDEEEDDAASDDVNSDNASAKDTTVIATVPLLRSIAEDKVLPQTDPRLVVAKKGKKKKAKRTRDDYLWNVRRLAEGSPAEVVSVESTVWSGAVAVFECRSKSFVNFYCGNGLKYTPDFYSPQLPAPIQANFDEFETYDEVIVEEKSEEENEDEENEDEQTTVTHIRTVFEVQKEIVPPPPEEKAEENAEEKAEDNDEEAAGEGAEEENEEEDEEETDEESDE